MSSEQTLRGWLRERPFSLALSAGFFGFYAHAGVAEVLLDEGLVPQKVTGASAGSMIAAGVGAGLSPSFVKERLGALRREHFWDPGVGAGLLKGRLFRGLLDDVLGGKRFEDAQVPVRISVFQVFRLRTRVVDSGLLAPAVHASCALPLMFHPVRVDGVLCTDGGVRDRAALYGLAGERVLAHHLVDKATLGAREAPVLDDGVVLALERIARPDPMHLERGIAAYDEAAQRTRAALDRPVARLLRG